MSFGFIKKQAFRPLAIFTVMLAVFLAGCSDNEISYNGKDISGLTGTESQLRELSKRYRTSFWPVTWSTYENA